VNAYPKAYLYRRIVKAKLFIDAHFAEPIDVDAISNKAAFSKFHFIRLFKQVYGANTTGLPLQTSARPRKTVVG
jgi:AraC-like DNA-binding protein